MLNKVLVIKFSIFQPSVLIKNSHILTQCLPFIFSVEQTAVLQNGDNQVHKISSSIIGYIRNDREAVTYAG